MTDQTDIEQPVMTAARWLSEAREREQAATPGPWRGDDEHGLIPGSTPAWCVSRVGENGEYAGDLAYIEGEREEADSIFIATARTEIPLMLEALEKLDKLNPQYISVRNDVVTHYVRLDTVREIIREALGVEE